MLTLGVKIGGRRRIGAVIPSDIPDGTITTMNGDMIVLSQDGDYVLTVDGFVQL